MAPVEPEVISRSNTVPLALFASQALLITGLTSHVLHTIRRAAKSLPPSAQTRTQQSVRRRNAAIYSALALLSLASVTTFGAMWRILSYFEWAEKGNHEAPGGLWSGWYGTGDEGIGRWRLGDWWSDVNLIGDTDAAILAAPEAFMMVYQHFCAVTAAAIFFGVEGRRRNIPLSAIASFTALGAVGSLGCALNLFFVAMLYTPYALHDDDSPRHDALFAPNPAVFWLPVLGAVFFQNMFPILLARREDLTLFRVAYFVVPLFLAFAPQIVPVRWGRRHATKAAAHHSYSQAFYALGAASTVLCWQQFAWMLFVNTPQERKSVYDLFRNAIGKHQHKPNRFLASLGNTAEQLKRVSYHPAFSVTSSDLLLTAIGLYTWTYLRKIDIINLLENSVLSFLTPKTEKHVAFNENVEKATFTFKEELPEETSQPPVTPRKRGRPKKSTTNAITPPKPRRSGRHATITPAESEAEESSYEPPKEDLDALKQIEADPAYSEDSDVGGGEPTALALLLNFLGGVGQLAASVLGAEVVST